MVGLPACIYEIADYYEVPIELIAAVKFAESSNMSEVGKIGPNRNGTYDLGIMQINTWWLEDAGDSSLIHWGIDEQELLSNPCTNLAVGTWILHQNLSRYKDTKKALAAYNAGKPNSSEGLKYAEKILQRLQLITSQK